MSKIRTEAERKRLELGNLIQGKRKEMELTQEQFADKFGYPRTTLAKLESGARDIKATEIVTLAEQLGVSCDYLLGRTTAAAPDEVVKAAVCKYGLKEETLKVLEQLGADSTSKYNIEDYPRNFIFGFNADEALDMLNKMFMTAIGDESFGFRILRHIYNYCHQEELKMPKTFKDEVYQHEIQIDAEMWRSIELVKLNETISEFRRCLGERKVKNAKYSSENK
jgi:transcriptional regulator with XRE-family HTH domain